MNSAAIQGIKRYQAIRESGRVERFHTIPHHLPYPIGQHCWGMLALLFVLYPEASRNLMWAIMFHDVGERWTGDSPGPAKNGHMRQLLEKKEDEIDEILGTQFTLSQEEQEILLALDYLDCLLYCLDELNMSGNRNFSWALDHLQGKLLQESWVPVKVRDFVTYYTWERTDERGPDARLWR